MTYLSYKGNITNMKTSSKKIFPLEIEESLHKTLKHKAIDSDMSLHAYIINALVALVCEEITTDNAGDKTLKNSEKG